MQVLAVCNQKGGVGKSTSTYHLARASIQLGLRTLVVDMDPQGNVSSALGEEDIASDQLSIADALSSRTDTALNETYVSSIWPELLLAPSTGAPLEYVRNELTGVGGESRLRKALRTVKDDFDLVLIDCAPSLDALTINALTAADSVLVVTQSKQWSLSGMARLMETIALVQDSYSPDLQVAGVLVNMHERQTISGQTWVNELLEFAQSRNFSILSPYIPRKVVISDAVEASKGLDEWDTMDSRHYATIYQQHLTTILETKP